MRDLHLNEDEWIYVSDWHRPINCDYWKAYILLKGSEMHMPIWATEECYKNEIMRNEHIERCKKKFIEFITGEKNGN